MGPGGTGGGCGGTREGGGDAGTGMEDAGTEDAGMRVSGMEVESSVDGGCGYRRWKTRAPTSSVPGAPEDAGTGDGGRGTWDGDASMSGSPPLPVRTPELGGCAPPACSASARAALPPPVTAGSGGGIWGQGGFFFSLSSAESGLGLEPGMEGEGGEGAV